MQKNTGNSADHQETLKGFVVPMQWDEKFRVTEVLIACEQERDVHVENLSTFPALLGLSQQKASITGRIRVRGGKETILVESVTPIGLPESG